MVEDRSNKDNREAEELILNLKFRAGEEREFKRNLVSGRHRRRRGAIEKVVEGVSFRCCCPGAMSASDGRRNGNTYFFVSVIPLVVGTAVYRGVDHI